MSPRPLETVDLLHWRACPRRYWHDCHADGGSAAGRAHDPVGADAAPHDDDIVPGPTARDALRASFPLAREMPRCDTEAGWAQALAATRQALQDPRLAPDGGAIFGACLATDDGVRVRIDVLARQPQGWSVHRLRLSTVGDDADVDAAALWVHVAARVGLRVQGVSLLLVDTDFVYPGLGLYAGIFRHVDLMPVLGTRPVPQWLRAMRDGERHGRPPAAPGEACARFGGCGHTEDCASEAAPPGATSVATDNLDVYGRERAAELRDLGYRRAQDVPDRWLPQPRLRRVREALRRDALVLDPDVAGRIAALGGPRRYLRIDTIGFAVPLWAGTQPYQALPFHWTCDLETADGLQPQAHLADERQDPRRRFAESLVAHGGDAGPVYAYNAGFERNRLRELARAHEDLAPALDALRERIVDLFQLAREACYHPAMAGSWSFRSIARALAPTLPLESFGTSAAPGLPPVRTPAEAYARSLQRGLPADERERLRKALTAHGHRETAVLQALVHRFAQATAS